MKTKRQKARSQTVVASVPKLEWSTQAVMTCPETLTRQVNRSVSLKQLARCMLTGRTGLTDQERNLLELPTRLGGLGILNPVKNAATRAV